jgi:hypothetical protein
VEPEAAITEMGVPHLLLYKHLLDRYTRVVNGSDLARYWPPLLVASGERSHTGGPIMDIIFFPCSSSSTAGFPLIYRKFLPSLVPYEVSEGVTLYELCGVRSL